MSLCNIFLEKLLSCIFQRGKSLFFCRILIFIGLALALGCDIEGEVKRGDSYSNLAPHSGAAGGYKSVVGGVYFDSEEGLTISKGGEACTFLRLSADNNPEWVTLDDTNCESETNSQNFSRKSLLFSQEDILKGFEELWEKNTVLEKKLEALEARLEALSQP